MKRILVTLFVIMSVFAVFAGGAKETDQKEVEVSQPVEAPAPVTVISSTKAKPVNAVEVELTRKAVLTYEELEQTIRNYALAGQSVTKEQLVQAFIASELLNQSMERDNFDVNTIFNQFVLNQIDYYAKQDNLILEDEQDIIEYLAASGLTPDEYAQSLVEPFQEELLFYYLDSKFPEVFETPLEPSFSDVVSFYETNEITFIASEKVLVSHIFFPVESSTDASKVRSDAEAALYEIKSGKISFEDAVEKYSLDGATLDKEGVLGWVTKPETSFEKTVGINVSSQQEQLFTKTTYDLLFSLDEGEVSSVLTSSQGYHIFRILEHKAEQKLAIEDEIFPGIGSTVYDFCESYVYEYLNQQRYSLVYSQMLESLRNEAKVVIN